MSNFVTSILLVGTELAVVLLIILGVVVVVLLKHRKKDKDRAMDLVKRLKKNEAEKCDNLKLILQETYGYGEEEALEKACELVRIENHLYSKVLRMYMGHDRDAITELDKDVFGLLDSYRGLVDVEAGDDSEKASSPVILKQENRQLRQEKKQLEADLAASIQTMENMMSEYASMYEGGKKEGEVRVKNEMFKLQQKIGQRIETDVELPDMDGLDGLDDFDIEGKPE